MEQVNQEQQRPKRIVILGGGISGLSAAFYVQKMYQEQQQPAVVTVIEQSETFGGKINTLQKEGHVIEKGPDSFLARKMAIIDLTRELGLEDQLVGTNPQAKKAYILHQGQLHSMPTGLVLGIPTQIMPFAKTSLLSFRGKVRAGLDIFLPRRNPVQQPGKPLQHTDESLGGFLQRRLGKEIVARIAEPLLAGIYAGDLYSLSLQATFPQFQQAEQKHGSIIRGMLANKRKAALVKNDQPQAHDSLFLTYRNGLQTLVDGLLNALADATLLAKHKVLQVHVNPSYDAKFKYEVITNKGRIFADAIIVALPAYTAAALFPHFPAVAALSKIPYVSVANVVLSYERAAFGQNLDGSGFVVPRSEERFITACTWTSAKWQHTAPVDRVMLRCYIGRSNAEDWVKLSDDELIAEVRNDLQQIMGITAEPVFTEVTRTPLSMPQYPVGHLTHIQQAQKELTKFMPKIFLTGAGYNGVGLPDCIRQGKETARHVVEALID